MSAKDAIDRYFARIAAKHSETREGRRKNRHPEKDLEREVLMWLKANGFACNVIEAKATYDPRRGRYLNSPAVAGFSDITGVGPGGIAVFIELKAPGRRSTLRPAQRAFLVGKIEYGAFAVVIDAVPGLAEAWVAFQALNSSERKTFLLNHLPKERAPKDDALFSDWNKV